MILSLRNLTLCHLFLFCVFYPLTAADRTIHCLNSECTAAELAAFEAALQAAQCGDRVIVPAGKVFKKSAPITIPAFQCTASNPVTIITSEHSQLPEAGTRITPSYSGLMAKFQPIGYAGSIFMTTDGPVHTKGLVFRGIEFIAQDTDAAVHLLLMGSNARSISDLAEDIIIDQCYLHGHYGKSARSGLVFNVRRGVLKNSFVSEFKRVGAGTDAYSILATNTIGPLTFHNNYLEAGSEAVILGGSSTGFSGAIPSDIDFRYNILTRPMSRYKCDAGWDGLQHQVKNLFEMKFGQRVTLEHNVLENNWANAQQGYGVVLGVRTEASSTPRPGAISVTGTTVTGVGTRFLTEPGTAAIRPGMAIHLPPQQNKNVWEVASVVSDTLLVLKTPAPTSVSNSPYHVVYKPEAIIQDITMRSNVMRNTANGFHMFGHDDNWLGNMSNIAIRDNLFHDVDGPKLSGTCTNAGPGGTMFQVMRSVQDLQIDHNTALHESGQSGTLLVSYPPTRSKISMDMRNNLLTRGTFGIHPQPAYNPINERMTSTVVQRNTITGGSPGHYNSGCVHPNVCSENLLDSQDYFESQFMDYGNGDFHLKPGSIYKNGGTDGKDLGADIRNLPLIYNLRTTAGSGTISLSYELSAPIQHVPCVLEVSPDISLERHTGAYRVVDDVNPLLRPRADSDRRSGNVVNGSRRAYFLNLTPDTRFYYRLMCGGDMRTGSFETLPAVGPASFVPLRVNVGGAAHVDDRGQTWTDDTGFTGGTVAAMTFPISGTSNSSVFQNYRKGAHSYRFAAPNGNYSVKLMFAEPIPNEASYRLFNVKINGQAVLTNFNIATAAGGVFTAVERSFQAGVATREIVINIEAVRGNPVLAGLEIVAQPARTVSMNMNNLTLTGSQTFRFTTALDGVVKPATWSINPAIGSISSIGLYSAPKVVSSVQKIQVTGMIAEAPGQPVTGWITLVPGTAGRIDSILINSGGPSWTNSQGTAWAADQVMTGTLSSTTASLITGTNSSPLYQNARWGAHGYQFAVPDGNYTVRLKFAEYQYTAAQQRLFNVAINGKPVLTSFDIFTAAGGAMKAIDREFTATPVNGAITIQAYIGSARNPQVNAVEVVQQ